MNRELFYISNLKAINDYIKSIYDDGRHILRIKDVEAYTGQCYRTVKRKYFAKGERTVSAESLARMLSGEGRAFNE